MIVQDLTYLSWSKIRESSGTTGSYYKSYSYSNGKKVYYKLSFFDSERKIFGYESINEIIAMNILKYFGYNHLEYKLINGLININGDIYNTYLTSSFDFKKENESKITLENFYDRMKHNNETIIDFCMRYGFIEDIYHMIIIDYLICNRDRHGANIEVLYNKNTKKYRLAPLFDHGLSMLSPSYLDNDLEIFDIKKERRANSFIGCENLFENLKLVPVEYFPKHLDINLIFKDFDFNCLYLEKSKQLLEWRWKNLENFRDKR